MKKYTSLIPSLVWYTEYSDCTIQDALLDALLQAPNNTLSLSDIGNIKVNGNRLLGSYGDSIRNLRNIGYKIKTEIYHHPVKKITCVTYKLFNPTHHHFILHTIQYEMNKKMKVGI